MRCVTWVGGILAMLGASAAYAADPVEEIVITATKREIAVVDAPASIAVVQPEDLADTHTQDLFQLAVLVPSMVFSHAPDDGLALTFRGIGSPARPQALDQSIALFLDGVFLSKGRLYPGAIFDIERIEVFRGPHAAEIGKNASIGAISVVSRTPGDEFAVEGRTDIDVENGGYSLDAATDLPIAPWAKLRLALNRIDSQGWVKNRATGNRVPAEEDWGFRGTLVLDPTENFSAVLRYQYRDAERLGNAFQLLTPSGAVFPGFGETRLDDRSNQFTSYGRDGESFHDTASHVASLRLGLELGEWELVSETAYVRFDADYVDDIDFNTADHVNLLRGEDFDQFSQELRLVSPSGRRLDFLLGIFYAESDWHSVENQRWETPNFPPPPDPLAGQLFNGPFVNDFQQDVRTLSGFASVTWHATERLRVNGGVRVTNEEKDVVFGRTPYAPFTFWNTVANPPFPLTSLGFDGTWADGNVSVQFDVTDTAMAYASFGQGTKLGGFVETNSVPTPDPRTEARIETEVARSYEVGVKSQHQGGRLALEAVGFYMDVEDFQDTTFTGSAFVTANLPVRSRGVELNARWVAFDDLDLWGSFTWANATAKIAGRELQMTHAPRWSGLAGLEYRRPIGRGLALRARADVHYRDAMYSQRGENFPLESLTTLGLLFAIEEADEGRWGFSVSARNVTDAVGAEFAGPTPDPTPPPPPDHEGIAPLRSVLISSWVRF
jgi:iron complex outermembrane receptor protein